MTSLMSMETRGSVYVHMYTYMYAYVYTYDVSTTKVFASYIQVLYILDEDLCGSKRHTITIYTVLCAMFKSSVTFESVAMSISYVHTVQVHLKTKCSTLSLVLTHRVSATSDFT